MHKEVKNFLYYVSQSGISRFLECRKKARLYQAGWFSNKPSRALRYGSFFHKMLEETIRESIRIKKIPSEEFVDFTATQNYKAWQKENKKLPKENQLEMFVDSKLIATQMKFYIKQYPSDFDGKKFWVATEKKFEVPYNGLKLNGYIDRVYMFKNKDFILETKTKSRTSQDIVDMLHLDFQTFFYIHGYYHSTGSFPAGTVYDIVQKFGSKQGVSEDVEEYCERFAEDLKKRPEFYYRRIQTLVSHKEYETWVETNLDPLLSDYLAWIEGEAPDYCNTTNCDGKYGSCEFLPICVMGDYARFSKKNFKDRGRKPEKISIEEVIDL